MSDPLSTGAAADHSTDVHSSDTVTDRSTAGPQSPSDLATELARCPELARDRSFVIDRAVAEYMSLALHNPDLSIVQYGQCFAAFGSSLQSSIVRQLEVERFIDKHPWLTSDACEKWPAPHEMIGQFEVLEELGRGGMARVYLCRQRGVGDRQVVLKIGRSAQVEAHTLGKLRHPNIVPVHSAEPEPSTGRAMLCMPFLGRSTLCDLVDALERGQPDSGAVLLAAARKRHRPTDELVEESNRHAPRRFADYHEIVAYLGERLAEALGHAHRQSIVHGDVKPSNILLSYWGEPLLMDFNLSGNAHLEVAARGGTLPYMPPEQLQMILGHEQGTSYDARSDIFSLGAVFYELLTGRTPFEAASDKREQVELAAELLQRQAVGYKPLCGDDSTIPRSLARIIEQCLATFPEGRFQTAEELRSAFQRELRTAARWSRWARARKRPLAIFTSLMLAGAALIVALIQNRPPAHMRLFEQGTHLRNSGDLASAEQAFGQSLDIAPDFDAARFELAHTLMQQGELDQASAEFHRLAESDSNARNLAYFTYCLCLQGRFAVALPWLRRAESFNIDAPEWHNNLGVALELAPTEHSPDERRRLAKQHLESALRQLPQSPTVRFNWVVHDMNQVLAGPGAFSSHTVGMATELAREFPSNGATNLLAATVIARNCDPGASAAAEGAGFLAAAIRRGAGPSRRTFLETPFWDAFRQGEAREKIVSAYDEPPSEKVGVVIERFLEPISLR